MKKHSILLGALAFVLTVLSSLNLNAQTACCPDFFLSDAVDICPTEGACITDPAGGSQGFMHMRAACKETAHVYTVFPNEPGFTFTWTVSGGTAFSSTGNPNTIVWGTGATGTITVYISNLSGTCVDSISEEICLIDGPDASFTASPNPVCQNTNVNFTNTSAGGSSYLWDFGDGTTSTLANPPPHSYALPGTYTVLLTVTDMGAGYDTLLIIDQTEVFETIPCGCSDTASMVIVVTPGDGPTIETDCCYGTVCPGETSSFCTSMTCASYVWSVNGGTIISGAGTSCIDVQWDSFYTGPTSVTLQNCATSTCVGSTTLDVPVLYPNLPIAGPTTLCAGASGTYTLPVLPGTYYNWTVSGGAYTFNELDRNTEIVNISFLFPSTYTVICQYNNPLSGCSGADTITVNVLPEFTIFGDDVVCEGSSNFYFASGAANWTITPVGASILSGNGTTTINASWTPGSYVVTATAINPALFCNASASQTVDVIAKPILNPILGDVVICADENYTYNISSNVTGENYSWSITNGTGNILSEMGADNDSIVVSWTGSGPWELSVYQEIEISSGVFCPSLIETLTITQFPAPIISVGIPTVCVDAQETYSVAGPLPPGGYNWSISPAGQGTIVSGQGTNSVDILWHGPSALATVTVDGCGGSDSYTVVVNGPPSAIVSYSTTPVFCLGDLATLTLSTPIVGGYTYQWYENGIPMVGAFTNTLTLNIATILTPGTYTYYVEVTLNGCTVESNYVDVIIEDCQAILIGGGGGGGGCDVVSFFRAYTVCADVTLINNSFTTGTGSIIGYIWTITGPGTGTFSPNNVVANPTISVSASGTYTIMLTVASSTGCTSVWTETINVLLPVANFTYAPPLCAGEPTTFSAVPVNPLYNYSWDFGDFTTAYTGVTEHAYALPSPPPYFVTLLISDQYGCTASRTTPVSVNPSPSCTLAYTDTAFCPGGSALLSTCSGMGSYQWYLDGNAIAGANTFAHPANVQGEYTVVVTSLFGCSSNTDSVYIYMHPLPVAAIEGEGYHCALASSTVNFYLSTDFDPDYSYSWTSAPAGATFTPGASNTPYVSLTLPAVLPITYQFMVDVTDITTGCTNSDTLCVTFYETPALNINSLPALNVCEGIPVTMSALPNNTGLYSYSWTGGSNSPVITSSSAGFYGLTITDKATGCSNSLAAGFIYPKPDMDLFPLGCDTICGTDSLHLYMPLPLQPVANWPFGTYGDAYPGINWYANGNYGSPVGSGENLYYNSATAGYDQLSVVVQNRYGCTDTAGVFCLNTNKTIKLDVSADTPCGCDSTLSFDLVNAADLSILQSIQMHSCDSTLNICIDSLATYDLVVSNGIVFPGAITGGIVNYPGGSIPFILGDNSLCCFAASDTNYVQITSSITYSSNTVWANKYYVADNVIVTVDNGATLDITNVDVVFGECAGIEFEDGAYLRANNSVFRPCAIDGTWTGISFEGSGDYDNIINESTFKNAEVALFFEEGADAVISNNLFSNCNFGIRASGNNNFNHPISGNRFVTDDFFPEFLCATKYSFINGFSTYGIYTMNTNFNHQVSQNDFINSMGNEFPRTYGIYQTFGGGNFSENTFTDMFNSIWLHSPLYYSGIENNEIEVSASPVYIFPTIYVLSSDGPILEINHNEITNNYNKQMYHSAIYTVSTSNTSIVGNEIYGFYYGIVSSGCTNHQISENIINDAHLAGIYVYESNGSNSTVTCNQIKMKSYSNTYGLLAYNMKPGSEVSSNCITDCRTSMYFIGWGAGTTGNPTLPLIRNNYLYNYTFAGIHVNGYSGNIGTITDPGMNTLYSNDNSAIDINSSTPISAADNYGMINVSFPQVTVLSTNPYHSTAACGHQIFGLPSQGNLNPAYSCDNFNRIIEPLIGSSSDGFKLAESFINSGASNSVAYTEANKILASYSEADEQFMKHLLNSSGLNDNEQALLAYNYYCRGGDQQKATQHISSLKPENQNEVDLKFLMSLQIQMMQANWTMFSDSDIAILESIEESESAYANLAITFLNSSKGYRDHKMEALLSTEDVAGESSEVRSIDDDYLNIYPVPASSQLFVEFINADALKSVISIYDASGRLVSEYSANYVAGGVELNISELIEGFYYLTLSSPESDTIKNGKFIKVNTQN